MEKLKYTCVCNFEDCMTVTEARSVTGGLTLEVTQDDDTACITLTNQDVRELHKNLSAFLGLESEPEVFKANAERGEILVGDRIKVTYKSGESATFTVVAVSYGGDYLTNWETGMDSVPFMSAIAHEVERYDILERPKALPTRHGAQISAVRTATGETVILTLTDSYLPWRGFTDDGEVFGLFAESFYKYLDSWEVVKA